MNFLKYFPEGVAAGSAFINRESERKWLASRIKANKHSVLMAPRRYGKTSLVMKVAEELKIPYCSIDLLAAYNEEYVRDQIFTKVSRLVFDLLPRFKKAKEIVINIFNKMKPEITLGVFGQRLNLSFSKAPLQDITEILLKLDETAKFFKKRAVIFMDEFQQISQLKNYHSIEASIRHAVERSENVTYVFSGSNRHMLEQMFGDQGRPLYRLCQTLQIERMSKEIYFEHFSKLAELRWKKTISTDAMEAILVCAELHPFYTNILCQLLWDKESIPTAEKINEIWHDYVKAQKRVISHDIIELSLNQRKVLNALSINPAKEIQSIDFTASIKMSASSAHQALEILIKKDLVHQTEDGFYRVLDPAMRYYLGKILWEQS